MHNVVNFENAYEDHGFDGRHRKISTKDGWYTIVFACDYSYELDPDDTTGATYNVDKPGIVLYKGRLIFIGSEADIGEQMQSHCILNGSFENLGDDGYPEGWTHKP